MITDELGKELYNLLINGMDWKELDEKYFRPFTSQKNVDYNNDIVKAINKHVPECGEKFSLYEGLIFTSLN